MPHLHGGFQPSDRFADLTFVFRLVERIKHILSFLFLISWLVLISLLNRLQGLEKSPFLVNLSTAYVFSSRQQQVRAQDTH